MTRRKRLLLKTLYWWFWLNHKLWRDAPPEEQIPEIYSAKVKTLLKEGKSVTKAEVRKAKW